MVLSYASGDETTNNIVERNRDFFCQCLDLAEQSLFLLRQLTAQRHRLFAHVGGLLRLVHQLFAQIGLDEVLLLQFLVITSQGLSYGVQVQLVLEKLFVLHLKPRDLL